MDSSDLICVICSENVETFCLDCTSPFYCRSCTEAHIHMTAGKNHRTINLLSGEVLNIKDESELHCKGCKNRNIVSSAAYLCPVCQELQCQKCYLIHSNFRFPKPHQVIELSRDGHITTTKAPSKMVDKKLQESIDDGQFSSDFEGALHITGATNIASTEAQAPLSVLSSGAVTEEKVVGFSNVTTQSVTNMAYVGDFDVKLDSERWPCRITSLTCLSDGRLVICDYDNNKVKVYNIDCKYLYSVQYSGGLCGVTVVSPNTVVVIENANTLRYLQLDTLCGVMLDKNIEIPLGALAVSYAVRVFAVLYTGSHREVVTINDNGVKLSVVKLTEVKGDIPLAILLDSNGTRFYICDYNNHRVLCYCCQPGHTGVLWACIMSPNPYSVVHVGDSLVVVCERKVHKINKSGHCSQEVDVHGKIFDISEPVAAFQTSSRKLVVAASWSYATNNVQIFQL